MDDPTVDHGATRLALSDADRRLLTVAGLLGGGALGAALPWLARLVDRLPFPVPFGDVVAWLGRGGFAADDVLRPLAGAVLGVMLAAWLASEALVVEVDDAEVRVVRRGETRHLRREQVAGVFREGRHVVIETAEGRRLLDDTLEGGRDRVREAFVAHGYPWEHDPDR